MKCTAFESTEETWEKYRGKAYSRWIQQTAQLSLNYFYKLS